MIKHDQVMRLQAWVDGELPEREAVEVERWIAQDEEGRLLVEGLRATREALREGDLQRALPESREFYWSKIRQGIEKGEREGRVEERVAGSWWQWMKRPAVAWGSAAVLALALAVVFGLDGKGAHLAVVHELETWEDGISPMTFRSETEKMTVVWISYAVE